MSSHYNTEPPPTASATLHTTVGPLHISLFAKQTPLACKNFLQHCLDGYYVGTIFHRVVPNFVIQGGDPTGTGSGGTSIYEDPEFEYDPEGRDPNEKVVFKDEFHSRLRFNRRGLLGMAKGEDGSYGSQFFITLANTEREMNNTCTLFGRIEGDSIYNVVKIADAELVEGTERPVYGIRITGSEVNDLGPFEGKLRKRDKVAVAEKKEEERPVVKKKKKAKGGKTLLSFGGDEAEDEDMPAVPAKPKFNTKLVSDGGVLEKEPKTRAKKEEEKETTDAVKAEPEPRPRKRQRSKSPSRSPEDRRHRPKTPDPNLQLPLPNPEEPSRSPPRSPTPPLRKSALEKANEEIASLKASMKRNIATAPVETGRKKSALEEMIPETSIRGRRRPPPGSASGVGKGSSTNGLTGFSSPAEAEALKLFNAFKARLESADAHTHHNETHKGRKSSTAERQNDAGEEDEEAQLCDLHFIANCQSCKAWDDPEAEAKEAADDDDDHSWMTHELRFGKDKFGKDLNWKKQHEEADSLVVIDPRQREKEIVGERRKGRVSARDQERELKRGRTGDLEWDRERRR